MTVLMDEAVDVGTTVRLSRVFESFDLNPIPVAVTGVACQVKDPEGSVQDCTVVQDALGIYHADVVVSISGQWWVRWTSDTPVRAYRTSFVVRNDFYSDYESPFSNPHVTWDEFNSMSWDTFDQLSWGEFA